MATELTLVLRFEDAVPTTAELEEQLDCDVVEYDAEEV